MNENETHPSLPAEEPRRHAVRQPAAFEEAPSSVPLPAVEPSEEGASASTLPSKEIRSAVPLSEAVPEGIISAVPPVEHAPEEERSAVPSAETIPEETDSPIRMPAVPSFVCLAEGVNTRMIDVLIALLPLVVWSCYLYGFRPLVLTAAALVAAILSEVLGRLLFHRTAPPDLSPVVTGVTVTLCLPPTAPLWLPALGAAIAVLLFRQLFGGWGRELFQPTAAAVAVLWLVFPSLMGCYAATGQTLSAFSMTVDGFTAASPLPQTVMQGGFLPEESLGSLFVGLGAGAIGQASALLLLAGFVYLLSRRIFRPTLPSAFLLTVAALSYLFPMLAAVTDIMALRYVGYQLISGDLLYGVIFMAADPVTSPRTRRGQLACGVIGGVITVLMRRYANPAVGVIAATLVMSLLSRPLDLWLQPLPFGGRRKRVTSAPAPAETDR